MVVMTGTGTGIENRKQETIKQEPGNMKNKQTIENGKTAKTGNQETGQQENMKQQEQEEREEQEHRKIRKTVKHEKQENRKLENWKSTYHWTVLQL